MAPAMPCKIMKNCGSDGSNKIETKFACILVDVTRLLTPLPVARRLIPVTLLHILMSLLPDLTCAHFITLQTYSRLAQGWSALNMCLIIDYIVTILEADESTRMRMGNSIPHHHQDHIAGKGENSLQHYNLVH